MKDILEEIMKSNIQERMEGLRLKICSCCTKVMAEGLQVDMVHLQRQVACNFGLERERDVAEERGQWLESAQLQQCCEQEKHGDHVPLAMQTQLHQRATRRAEKTNPTTV